MKSTGGGGKRFYLWWIFFYMCFDELDTVESMRGHTMLCFMCPTVTAVGFDTVGQ